MNVNFNYTIGKKHKNKNKLSAQDEYWLDRILRNHSTQIFVIVVLFFTLILASVIYAIANPETSSSSNKIEINGARIIITQ
jgi:hypothetical protein